jgi:hypothetical protein
MLAVNHREFARAALSAPSGSDGLLVVPYVQKGSTPTPQPSISGATANV